MVNQFFYNLWKGNIYAIPKVPGLRDEIMPWAHIKDLIKKHGTDTDVVPVVVTGHGIGGVIAQLAALHIKAWMNDHGYNSVPVQSINYGAPAWCNQAMADYFDSTIKQSG